MANFTSVSDAFSQLRDLDLRSKFLGESRSTLQGGQNITRCCLLAVNQSISLMNGKITKNHPSYIDVSIDQLFAATDAGLFPCGSTYNGNNSGAPIVEVPFAWLHSNCPGWQLSDSAKGDESKWVLPFVGFLLPAVVFCLTISRRRKLAIWHKLFISDMSRVVSWMLAPVAMALAGVIALCDAIIWLSICFAFASPMLISGFYEALLDNQIINFLQEKTRNLTLDMKARLLFVILAGNLDINSEIRPQDEEYVGMIPRCQDKNARFPDYVGLAKRNPSSPWTHVENLIHPLRSYRDSAQGTPRQWPLHDTDCIEKQCTDLYCKETPIKRDCQVHKDIQRTKTRLRTMLASQHTFSATVGAPVIFFLGSFVFALVETLGNLGDQATSLSLAFGMWYMIIPHLSIVSGLLLSCDNPNILEAVVALEFEDSDLCEPSKRVDFFELAYASRYRPAWLWLRGKSKRDWVERVWKTYEFRQPSGPRGRLVPDDEMSDLKKLTRLSVLNWTVIIGLTALLLYIPFVLAFITAWFTPQIGLSCRSLTFLVYALCQTCQLALWVWAYAGSPSCYKNCSFFREAGYLERHGFYTPTDISSLRSTNWNTLWTLKSLWAIIWYTLATAFGLGAIFTALGGTLMQLLGVYTSNICQIDAQYWSKDHEEILVIISSNYALEIADARMYWVSSAICATVFLAGVSFAGWWYQRRLRSLFRNLVNDLGDPRCEREDIRVSLVRI